MLVVIAPDTATYVFILNTETNIISKLEYHNYFELTRGTYLEFNIKKLLQDLCMCSIDKVCAYSNYLLGCLGTDNIYLRI